jgi:hypothetical protein
MARTNKTNRFFICLFKTKEAYKDMVFIKKELPDYLDAIY